MKKEQPQDINEKIRLLDNGQEAEATIFKRYSTQQEQNQKENSRIVKLIQEGKTSTGSRIQDCLIVNFGVLPKEQRKKYEKALSDLEKRLLEKRGELVLVEEESIDSSGCGGFGGRLSYFLKTELRIGIVEESAFRFLTSRDMAVGVRKGHIHSLGGFRVDDWMWVDSDIVLNLFSFLKMTVPDRRLLSFLIGPVNPRLDMEDPREKLLNDLGRPLNYEVVTGNKEVENYFTDRVNRKRFDPGYMPRLTAAITYQTALKALSLDDIPLPPDFVEVIKERREKIVTDLLQNNITFDTRRAFLQEALRLSMHEIPGIYEEQGKTGVKTTVDVPSFIRSQCEKEKIKIPDKAGEKK